MDINTLRGIATALALIAFIAVWVWAWSGKRKRAFDEAANLPFADEDIDQQSKGVHHE
jgi:cytochrome c oxidase cbb3-type subunit 4